MLGDAVFHLFLSILFPPLKGTTFLRVTTSLMERQMVAPFSTVAARMNRIRLRTKPSALHWAESSWSLITFAWSGGQQLHANSVVFGCIWWIERIEKSHKSLCIFSAAATATISKPRKSCYNLKPSHPRWEMLLLRSSHWIWLRNDVRNRYLFDTAWEHLFFILQDPMRHKYKANIAPPSSPSMIWKMILLWVVLLCCFPILSCTVTFQMQLQYSQQYTPFLLRKSLPFGAVDASGMFQG